MCCSFIIPEECIVSNITEILFFFLYGIYQTTPYQQDLMLSVVEKMKGKRIAKLDPH